MLKSIQEASAFLCSQIQGFVPEIGIILGSGLGNLANEIETLITIAYQDIPHFLTPTVHGHQGKLIFGHLSGKPVVAMQGRYHAYEGHSMQQITFPVRVMKHLGIHTLIVSNAAGGMNPDFQLGELMIITDHINFMSSNPLIGKNEDTLGPRFVDMNEPYSKTLITKAKAIASHHNIRVKEGVYLAVTGPCFETPAEYNCFWRLGADAVGMSTVPEIIIAKHAGLQTFGISIITDLGISGQIENVSHEEVLQVAQSKAPALSLLIRELVKEIS